MPVLSNSKHERFAQEIAKGVSASAAFVTAGYAKNDGNASRLNGNEKVRARVEELLSEGAEKAGVTVQRIVEELAKIGFGNVTEVVDWGEAVAVTHADTGEIVAIQGISIKAAANLPATVSAAISEIRQTKEGLAVKMHSKLDALDKLGKHLGIFKDKVEHSGSIQAFTIKIGDGGKRDG